MMKVVFVLACVLAATFADDDLAHKQQTINRLLHKVSEPMSAFFEDLYEAGLSFNPKDHTDNCHDGGEAVHRIMREIEDNRMLEKHHWFSLFNDRHREEALMVFDVLSTCKNFESFKNNAAFFRGRVNEGVFVYALYVSVTHSPLTQDVYLPPLYEITPHMFANSEIVQEAYIARMRGEGGNFHMNFTGSRRNPEQRVAYFGEDIGLNSHHVHWHMDFPFWSKEEQDRRGELFFWVHHQLTARFDAERLSNRLPFVDELYWDRPIVEGFAPHTTYQYGGEFPSRPDNKEFNDVEGIIRIRDVKEMESRVRDAIAHGYFLDHEGKTVDISNDHGIDIVGNAIESSKFSPHQSYYGALHNYAHILLGRQADPKGKFNMPPGVMEHFETATRDPSFFRLHKYMDTIFKEHKNSLPHYSKEELRYENVEIKDIKIEGELKTFFEVFKFDLTNALEGEGTEPITAEVDRLNHKPFEYDIEVHAQSASDVMVRIFFCPKYDYNHIEMTVDEARWHCIEMDKFRHHLEAGDSHIKRKSSESSVSIGDRKSFNLLKKEADDAVSSGSKLDYGFEARACGHPDRLLLPKGHETGMDFEYFVDISSGEDAIYETEADHNHAYCGRKGQKYPDKKPMGYPLDRPVPDDRNFKVPNIMWKTVQVYHEHH